MSNLERSADFESAYDLSLPDNIRRMVDDGDLSGIRAFFREQNSEVDDLYGYIAGKEAQS
jgi:hypothetical protein